MSLKFIFLFIIPLFSFAQDIEISELKMNANNETGTLINKLLIDEDNFLWYTTFNGLVKNLHTDELLFPNNQESASKFDLVNCIYQDSKSRIWIGENEGIFLLDKNKKEIEFIDEVNNTLQISSFIEDCDGNIWAGTKTNHILKIDSELKIKKFEIDKKYLNSYIRSAVNNYLFVERVSNCNEIIFRQNQTLLSFNDGTIEEIFTPPIKDLSFGHNYIGWNSNGGSGTLITDNGDLFPKNSSGSYSYNNTKFKYFYIEKLQIQILEIPFFEMLLVPKALRKNVFDFSESLAIDIKKKNIFSFKLENENNEYVLKEKKKIPFEYFIEHIAIDDNGIVYISSLDKIYKIKSSSVGFKKRLNDFGLKKDHVNVSTRSIEELDDGSLIVASYSGVFKINPKSDSVTHIFPKLTSIRNTLKTKEEIIWAVEESSYLLKLDIKNKIIKRYSNKHSEKQHLDYFDLIKLTDSTLLLASKFGLDEFNINKKTFEKFSFEDDFDSKEYSIRDLLLIKEKLFIATENAGVFVKDLTTGNISRFHTNSNDLKTKIASNKIYTLQVEENNKIWVGHSNGVDVISSFGHVNTPVLLKENLGNKKIAGILFDNQNKVWISTYNGIYSFDFKKKKYNSYYEKNGLPSNEFNQNSYFKNKKGTLIFGSINGLVIFDSIQEERPKNLKIFPISLTYFNSSEKKQVVDLNTGSNEKSIDLSYKNSSLNISFSINDLFNTEEINYAYKFDRSSNDEWINLKNNNALNFLSIPPGKHLLKIKGSNSSNIESSNELKYYIKVSQVFYKESWFYLAFSFFMILIIVLTARFKLNNQKKVYLRKLTLIELQNKSLLKQLNPHFIFNTLNNIKNNTKTKKFNLAEDELVEFSKLLRNSLDLTRNDWVAISKEIDFLKNYINLHNTSEKNKILFKIKNNTGIELDDLRIPSMLLQPIVENSIVHGFDFTDSNNKKNIISIVFKSISKKEKTLTIEIIDNGLGFKRKNKKDYKNESYGMSILKERIELYNKLFEKKNEGFYLEQYSQNDLEKTGMKVVLKIPIQF